MLRLVLKRKTTHSRSKRAETVNSKSTSRKPENNKTAEHTLSLKPLRKPGAVLGDGARNYGVARFSIICSGGCGRGGWGDGWGGGGGPGVGGLAGVCVL